MPKLWEEVRPATRKAEDSIRELVRFARDEVPAKVWREEFGRHAPPQILERHEHHYHVQYNDYRTLSHHVRNVVTWENQTPVFVWPTVYGFRFLFLMVAGVVVLVWLPELVGLLLHSAGR